MPQLLTLRQSRQEAGESLPIRCPEKGSYRPLALETGRKGNHLSQALVFILFLLRGTLGTPALPWRGEFMTCCGSPAQNQRMEKIAWFLPHQQETTVGDGGTKKTSFGGTPEVQLMTDLLSISGSALSLQLVKRATVGKAAPQLEPETEPA